MKVNATESNHPGHKLTIILSGMIAAVPHQGGAVWAVLQYLMGFRRLGHEVYFVEPLKKNQLQPDGSTLEESENVQYFQRVMAEFGLKDHSALLLEGTQDTFGLSYNCLLKMAERADLLVNISGMLTDKRLKECIPLRVYLDLDPAFNQLWHAVDGIDVGFNGHSHFVTVGLAIGEPDCTVPACDRSWITTLQPIVLPEWPIGDGIHFDALTTVGNWRGYGSVEYGGVFYGQKAHALRNFMELPMLTEEKFALALSIHPDETRDLAALEANRWKLLDPLQVANTPANYSHFIRVSKGEFGIAKSGYVASRSGWFSDRSVCYLASGKPVIAQETGFSRYIPTGEGLFSFETKEDVLDAIDAINADYLHHSKTARAIAEDYFDSDKVLARLLQSVGAIS
jgi:hypothetical protein